MYPSALGEMAVRAVVLIALGSTLGGVAHPVTPTLLVASDGISGQDFGHAVSISGDLVVVGAPDLAEEPPSQPAPGAAYVFERPAAGWGALRQESAKLLPPEGSSGTCFGCSVATDGDLVVVGSLGDDFARTDTAYVFRRPPGGWSGTLRPQARLELPPEPSPRGYGAEVAVAGGTIVVGNAAIDPEGFAGALRGAAFVYVEPQGGWAGTIAPQATLRPSAQRDHDSFGSAVAITGDTVLVGAPGALTPRVGPNAVVSGNRGPGAAYVFVRPAAGWAGVLAQDAILAASDGEPNDGLGAGVGLGEYSTAVVADRFGKALVFERPLAGWSGELAESAGLAAADGSPLGRMVAMDGRTILASGALAAHVFLEPQGGWKGTVFDYAKLAPAEPHDTAGFGQALAVSGRALLVGAHAADAGETPPQEEGAAFLYQLGSATCVPSPERLCLRGGRFAVEADWSTGLDHGGALARLLTSDTGAFSFFGAPNLELVVKVLDGCALNQRFWVFAGGLTDVGVELRITDTETDQSTTYRSEPGDAFGPVQDTDALLGCSSGDGGALAARGLLASEAATGTRQATAAPASSCDAEAGALCFGDGRFIATAGWTLSTGETGTGLGVEVTSDTGYFTFFDPANVELVIKVLDACGAFGYYWVFAGGLTNVETEIEVTDLQRNVVRRYQNPPDTPFQSIQDTVAFPCQ